MALNVEPTTLITMVYAIFVAMALHGWYYKTASVNALAALPVRREAWFCTNLVTALTMGTKSLEELLGHADEALYEVKRKEKGGFGEYQ